MTEYVHDAVQALAFDRRMRMESKKTRFRKLTEADKKQIDEAAERIMRILEG